MEVNTRPTDDPHDFRLVFFRKVSPAYFDAAGIRLLRGRVFGETGAGKRVDMDVVPLVISDTFARALWPSQDPMGKRVRLKGSGQGEVIGVAADISSMRPSQVDGPVFYAPIQGDVIDSVLIVRGTADVSRLIPDIRSHIHTLDSALLPAPETVDAIIGRFVERYSVVLRVASIAQRDWPCSCSESTEWRPSPNVRRYPQGRLARVSSDPKSSGSVTHSVNGQATTRALLP